MPSTCICVSHLCGGVLCAHAIHQRHAFLSFRPRLSPPHLLFGGGPCVAVYHSAPGDVPMPAFAPVSVLTHNQHPREAYYSLRNDTPLSPPTKHTLYSLMSFSSAPRPPAGCCRLPSKPKHKDAVGIREPAGGPTTSAPACTLPCTHAQPPHRPSSGGHKRRARPRKGRRGGTER